MNRIKKLFQEKPKGICSIFLTAGYPRLDSTVETVLELEAAGVDLIELGIPFSDPLADGTTIQHTSEVALQNGMTIALLLNQLESIREQSEIPIVLMGYFNPIYKYGIQQFLTDAKKAGADGIIIPDLNIDDYDRFYLSYFEDADLPLTFLFTPLTPIERIMSMVNRTKTFLYFVSSASTTGKSAGISEVQKSNALTVFNQKFEVPILMGFGIHDQSTFEFACEYFNGGIIGSAFLRHIGEGGKVSDFVKPITQGMSKTI